MKNEGIKMRFCSSEGKESIQTALNALHFIAATIMLRVKYYSILCSTLHAKYFSSQMTVGWALRTMASRTR